MYKHHYYQELRELMLQHVIQIYINNMINIHKMQQNKLCSLTTSPQDVDICRDILYLLLLYDVTLVDYGIVTYAWITFPLFMAFLRLCVQTKLNNNNNKKKLWDTFDMSFVVFLKDTLTRRHTFRNFNSNFIFMFYYYLFKLTP